MVKSKKNIDNGENLTHVLVALESKLLLLPNFINFDKNPSTHKWDENYKRARKKKQLFNSISFSEGLYFGSTRRNKHEEKK